ncbi:MAG: hypothetical protein MRY63_11445 [Neomegalonema sp.]|nr:hypothetical protein [Neomegalonema sp.]
MADEPSGDAPGEAELSYDDALFMERPSAEFVDGFLAGLAVANAAAAGGEAQSLFYSFEWIGDGEEERDQALYSALQSDPTRMALTIEPLDDWESQIEGMAQKWLVRDLPIGAARTVSEEFLDLLQTFLGDDEIEVFRVSAAPAPGCDDLEPPIGAEFDHLLFEIPEGRVLLEFSRAL